MSKAPHDDSSLAVGRKPVLEMLRNSASEVESVIIMKGAGGKEIGLIMDACRAARVRYTLSPRAALDRLFEGNHQGVVARMASLKPKGVDEVLEAGLESPLKLVVALDQVQDPGNVGTLARTLWAVGAGGIILPKHNAAFLGPAAVKASAGAIRKLPVARATNLARALDEARDAGYMIYTAESSDQALDAISAPLALPAVLVLGNEEKGIRPNVAKRADAALAIPFGREFDSLNVAQAGALLVGRFMAAAR